MTIEEIKALGLDELETRAQAIAKETAEADSEKLDELNAEMDAIEERRAELKEEAEKRKAAADAVANGAGAELKARIEERKMTNAEVRKSKEYIDAYAKYIKTGKDAECRALLTENVEGAVPVPTYIEGRVRTAWENDEIFQRVAKTFVSGNLKVGFELSATDAAVHQEGAEAPEEERLVLGIVTMVPAMIKKWITVSDEVLSLGSEEFLNYIYDEVAYKVIQKAADIVIEKIEAAPAESTATAIGVKVIDGGVDAATIIDAIAELGDQARNNVLIADGATIAAIKKFALTANYAYDPFGGLTVIQKAGVTGAIIGDLAGVQANLPNGDAVQFIFDELSLAEKDLVKIVGKLYAAIEVVGPEMLVRISGEASE